FMQLHGAPLDRLPETRPAGPRLELRLRAEQLSSTTGTPIHAALLRRGVRTGERALRSLVAQHLELLGRQSPAPLLFGPGKRLRVRQLLGLVRHDISSSSFCLGRGTIRYRGPVKLIAVAFQRIRVRALADSRPEMLASAAPRNV